MKQLLCLGDSITDAGRLFSGNSLGNGYVSLLAKALGPDCSISNRGVDGFTVMRVFQQLRKEYYRYSPDVVTILAGINDVGLMKNTNRTAMQQKQMMENFSHTYEQMIAFLLKGKSPRILLLEPFIFPVPAEYAGWFPQVKELSERIQDLAWHSALTFVPLWDDLLTLGEKTGYDRITTDGIHLTGEGHACLAEEILKNL